METGGDHLLKQGSSFRGGSSSIWSSATNAAASGAAAGGGGRGGDSFSQSSRHHHEADEAGLILSAIQRLPTFDRLRKGVVRGGLEGGVHEVDVQHLGFADRKELIDRLISVTDKDNQNFLLKLNHRIRRVGIEIPTIEVRFEHLNVEAEAHVGTRALPTFINFTVNILEGLLNTLSILPNRKRRSTILHDISGIIKPKRMTLLLGPPNSGKTTLLLALAGKLDKGLKVSGKVMYNGYDMEGFVPQRTAAYISQYDVHLGELTVRETLSYSARFQGVGDRYEMLAELSRREMKENINPDPDVDLFMKAVAMGGQEANVVTDYVLKILGLENCADTLVGDEMRRGISGGERKRVTIGEMLVGPSRAFFCDEISTGLDSSTTFQVVNSMRQFVHVLDGTALISLLQPPPETYNLFDDIILLSDKVIVYQGPRDNVLEFFEYMGFRCPERKGVADFLQEVTSKKDQQQYWAREEKPYRFISAEEFSEAFQSFHVGQNRGDELGIPYDKSKSHPAALETSRYGTTMKDLFSTCLSREFLLMKRNSFVYIFRQLQLVFMALVTITVFLRTKMDKQTAIPGGSVYMGSLFQSVTIMMFYGLAENTMILQKLPVFYKQRDFLFFPSWAYAIPNTILKIPVSCFEVAIWAAITYYPIGYDSNVARFFKQYLIFVLVNQMASGLFRFVGATARDMIVANTFGSFNMLMLFSLSGFILSRDDIKKWWIWGYWISPMMYAENAIAANEFLGNSWDQVVLGSNDTLGVVILKSRGFYPYASWVWIGSAALVGFTILFNILFIASLTFLNPYKTHQAKIQDESQKTGGKHGTGGGNIEMDDHTSYSHKRNSYEDNLDDLTEQKDVTRPTSSLGSLSKAGYHVNLLNKRKGMILPFEPHYVTFDEIRYFVDMPSEIKKHGVTETRLELLKGVSGAFKPGVLTALMGATGAGKTTLLDVLAGRKTGGYIEGCITISGFPKKQETFARISGYCEQTDIHSPHVTIYESLLYSAWLRLSPEVDARTREMFIEEVMELVELSPLRRELVGLPGVNGLSIEQRKRLTIAVELVANPSIIFMDEPTSGLDARAAAIVMRTIRNTVDTGRTVVCTIHQPGIDIFETFDELFLLKQGQEIYAGPLGHQSCEMIQYFEAIPGSPRIEDGYNPATWMLEVTTQLTQERNVRLDFAEIYEKSDLCRRNKCLVQELSRPSPGAKELYFSAQYAQPFIIQCTACLWKQHWSYWRNPSYTAVRLYSTIVIALMFGTMFWDLGGNLKTVQDLFNAMGSMYAAVLFLGVQNASSVQPVVSIERTVYYREKAAGMYSSFPYAFAQAAIEIPYVLVQATVYSLIVYPLVGFDWDAGKVLWYIFFMFFTLVYFTFYGMMTVAVTPNHHIAAVIASAFYAIWNVFAGFLIPRTMIPIWWRWYYWGSPMAWTLYGLFASQYGDVDDILSDGSTVKEFIQTYFGFEHDFLGVVAVVMVGISILFALIFAFSVRIFNFQHR